MHFAWIVNIFKKPTELLNHVSELVSSWFLSPAEILKATVEFLKFLILGWIINANLAHSFRLNRMRLILQVGTSVVNWNSRDLRRKLLHGSVSPSSPGLPPWHPSDCASCWLTDLMLGIQGSPITWGFSLHGFSYLQPNGVRKHSVEKSRK